MTGLLPALALVTTFAAAPQVGRAWTYDDRVAESDVVVLAEVVESRDTGRMARHPTLSPGLPVVEMETELRVLSLLKGALVDRSSAGRGANVGLVLHHYRFDRPQWERENPPEPGLPQPGLARAGTYLQFSPGSGPFVLFLRRTERGYEPTTGHTFPTESVFWLSDSRNEQPRQPEQYHSVTRSADGHLAFVGMNGRPVTVRLKGEQTGFADPVVSPDGTVVAAQAMFPNCCTSYDLPLELVVYTRGRERRFTGNGLPIFHWGFIDDGRRIALGQEPAHFGCAVHYELRDVLTGDLIESVDVPQACGQNPTPEPVALPDWVARIKGR